MTTPAPSDGTERTKPPASAPDEEPLPPTGSGRGPEPGGTDEPPLITLAAGRPGPGGADEPKGSSFAADFAGRNFFAGVRFLKPGRRVTVALAGVTGLAVIGVGVAAGVSRLGDDTVRSAAEVHPTDPASATPEGSAPAGSVKASHRPSGPPKARPGKAGGAPVADPPGAPTQTVTATPTGNTTESGTTTSTTGTVTQQPKTKTKTSTTQTIHFTGGFVQGFASGRCLATQGGSRTAGTQVVIADCDSSDPSQGWTFPSDGTARDFGGTMCLDVSDPGDGAPVRLAQCSSSRSANQRFVLKSSYDLVDVSPDLCADVKDKNTAAGTAVQLWSCSGTSNQKWRNA